MTLILSQITQDYVIQVSDRRLTYDNGSIGDDEANKAVLYCGQFAFSYTGLSCIDGRRRTDAWLLDTLIEPSRGRLDETLEVVRDAATSTIRSSRIERRYKRLAIVGVGWVSLDGSDNLSPLYVSISNFQNDDGEWTDSIQENFTIFCTSLATNESQAMFVAGQRVDREIQTELDWIIRRCIRGGVGPGEISRWLAYGVRSVATNNPFVGSNLMITSIPRVAVKASVCSVMSGWPTKESIYFANLPSNTDSPIRYAPPIVAFGGAVTEIKQVVGFPYEAYEF